LKEAEADANNALEGAKSSGLVDEQWRSLYVLGRIAEAEDRRDAARDNYTEAVGVIEAIRTGIRSASLRGEFLADKRDVYDALIDLRLREGAPVDKPSWSPAARRWAWDASCPSRKCEGRQSANLRFPNK
jgi:hypothetical protein